MRRTPILRALSIAFATTLIVTSCSGRDDNTKTSSGTTEPGTPAAGGIDTSNCPDNGTAGISGGTITLASSFPQSGLTAAFAQISKGYNAYFAKLNADGGVEVAGKKYKIKVVDKDDEYNASKTVQNINELAGTDGSKAFAVFNVVGTANNIAIRSALGENCVPNVFAATGSTAWGNPKYPWTIGSTLAPYPLEAKAFADHLAKVKPSATVAMLVQDDDFGRAYEEGFRNAIKGTKITLVKVAKYPTGAGEVASQVTSLAATKADAFFNGATLLACPNALQEVARGGWKPITFVSGTCISKTLLTTIAGAAADGVLAATNLKDPQDPKYATDAAFKEYKETLAKYADKDVEADNGIVAYGYTQAAILVEALKASKSMDRAAFMNSMHNLADISGVGLLLPGVSVHTGDGDPFLAEDLQLFVFDATAKHLNPVGGVIDLEGKTADFTPKDLINS